MCYVFRYALLPTTVVTRDYWAWTSLVILFWPLPPSRCFHTNHGRLWSLLFMEIPGDHQFQRVKLCTPSGTNDHSTVKVTNITFLPHSNVWSEQQLNLYAMSACLYALTCHHMIGKLNICINELVYRIQLLTVYTVYAYIVGQERSNYSSTACMCICAHAHLPHCMCMYAHFRLTGYVCVCVCVCMCVCVYVPLAYSSQGDLWPTLFKLRVHPQFTVRFNERSAGCGCLGFSISPAVFHQC